MGVEEEQDIEAGLCDPIVLGPHTLRATSAMSDHTTALVPIEAWAFQSPGLRAAGRQVDCGLFAESLIYYDRVLLNLANQPQLAELLQWLISQNALGDFLALVADGTITFYEYSFASAAILKEGKYVFGNLQDELQAQPNTFERRFLYHRDIAEVLPHARQRSRLYRAFRDHVIEVKAEEFGASIENARSDFRDPRRASLVLQVLVDAIYALRGRPDPPAISAVVRREGDEDQLTFSIDLSALGHLGGDRLGIHLSTVLAGTISANRLLWSAAQRRCDLYLPSPIDILVGNKLYESTRVVRPKQIVETLQASVEFPDIQALVNAGTLPFREVLRIRSKATKFRAWLQDESSRSRDLLIAYHHEVAKESGLVTLGRKSLRLLGVLGGGAAAGAIGALVAGPMAGAFAGVGTAAGGYLADVGSRVGEDWKPVVFGNWLKDRIEGLLDGS